MPNSLFLPFCGSETQYVSEPKGIKKQKKKQSLNTSGCKMTCILCTVLSGVLVSV